MMLSYKLVVYTLILVILVLAITTYNQRNVRKYTPLLRKQIRELVDTASEHIETAKNADNAIITMQQACYAASTLDAVRAIVIEEDVPRLTSCNFEKLETEVHKLQVAANTKLYEFVYQTPLAPAVVVVTNENDNNNNHDNSTHVPAGPNYPIESTQLLYVIHAGFRERGPIGLAAANNYLNRLRSLERIQCNSIIYSCEPLILTADPENLRNATYQRKVAHKILCAIVNAKIESEDHLQEIDKRLREKQQLDTKLSPVLTPDGESNPESGNINNQEQVVVKEDEEAKFVTADELFVTPACWKNPKQNYAIVQSIGYVNGEKLNEPMLIVYGIVNTEKQYDEFSNLLDKHSPQTRPQNLTESITCPALDYSVLDNDTELQAAHQWRNLAYRWALNATYPYLCVPVDEAKTPWVNKSKDIKEMRVFNEPNNPHFDKGKALAESETQAQKLIDDYVVEERRRMKACQEEKVAND